MSTYAIGDVQGCYQELQQLLADISFDPNQDTLWFAGDLVNRGPHSLDVLRFIKSLPHKIVVLGNHDLHFLAVAYEALPLKKHDTLQDVLNAPDCIELCEWLRKKPFVHHDDKLGFTMVHAGIPPQWTVQQAVNYSHELEAALRGDEFKEFFQHMYGNKPSHWNDDLSGWKRLRLITNYFTRMRFVDEEGRLELDTKSGLDSQPEGYFPWFSIPGRQHKNDKILFGHWAALEGKVNEPNVFALDTGCVWGGKLTALRLDDLTWFSVESQTSS